MRNYPKKLLLLGKRSRQKNFFASVSIDHFSIHKWWKAVFFYLVNSLLHDSFVVYNLKNSYKNNLDYTSFRKKIVEELLKNFSKKKKSIFLVILMPGRV